MSVKIIFYIQMVVKLGWKIENCYIILKYFTKWLTDIWQRNYKMHFFIFQFSKQHFYFLGENLFLDGST